jgi:hypothetical protein
MTEQEFFKNLQEKTEKIFYQSEIYAKNKDKNWFYSICNGPILRHKPIIFGLNWGVSNDPNYEGHKAQKTYPENIDQNTWKFKSHVNTYLIKYFGYSFDEVNYSNQCFFRTPNEKFLSYQDWRDSIALFREYVQYINPPYLIMLGRPRHLNNDELKDYRKIGYLPLGSKRRSFVRLGTLFDKYAFGSVPHSSAHISPDTHDELWKILKENLK